MSAPNGRHVTRRPDLFIVGAGTAGTTALYEYLLGHPQVYMSPIKEPDYFCPDVVPDSDFSYGTKLDKYLALFTPTGRHRRVGEASTSYLRSSQAPALIREFEPEARIVIMLRNPIDRMHSMHSQRVALGLEPIGDLEAALDSEAAGFPYLERARVADHVSRWLDTFGTDRVHVIIFDDFAADTEAVFRKVLEFLEVDPNLGPRSFEPRNTSYRQRAAARTLFTSRAAQWAAHGVLPRLIGDNATQRLSRSVRHSRICRRPNRVAPMRAGLRRRLAHELSADDGRLSTLLQRDLRALWFGRPALGAKSAREE
ncbi:MAG: sulfotransferase [Chloroflexota bacterium]